jgi:hypothetical protein
MTIYFLLELTLTQELPSQPGVSDIGRRPTTLLTCYVAARKPKFVTPRSLVLSSAVMIDESVELHSTVPLYLLPIPHEEKILVCSLGPWDCAQIRRY